VFTYATIPLSTRTLGHLTHLLAAHRDAIGSTDAGSPASQQAILVLAHLRNGDSYTRLPPAS
jgi:hypothetical protein